MEHPFLWTFNQLRRQATSCGKALFVVIYRILIRTIWYQLPKAEKRGADLLTKWVEHASVVATNVLGVGIATYQGFDLIIRRNGVLLVV